MTEFSNCYQDAARAEAYAKLEFPNTYYLAYRDLPAIFSTHVRGRRAVDFGCGAGRSTRFLRDHGFETIGIDISEDMLKKAREFDPSGDYRRIADGGVAGKGCDLVLSAFTFDNVPTLEKKVRLFRDLAGLLNPEGRIVNLVSSPEIYRFEWASFSVKDFPRNLRASSGDVVKIIQLDTEDKRPVEDILWTDESYRDVYRRSALEVEAVYRPLARKEEPFDWVNETAIPPWVIYVLKKAEGP
jgi:trans-aconitate methyltransferase